MKKASEVFNPFSITSYLGKEYFCDRVKELDTLQSALYNMRNVTLVSPRKMGKTGLLRHLFASVPQNEVITLYVDLDGTACLKDFIKVFSEALLNQTFSVTQKIASGLKSVLSGIRPTLTPNSLTGEMSWSVSVEPYTEQSSLSSLFQYLESLSRPCYVALDEFQRIVDYPEKNMEALLRSHIQHLTNVHFVFAGSQRHLMSEMFASPARPFFQSTQMMTLSAINEEQYATFARHHLAKAGISFSKEGFHSLYEMLHGHTWYIQCLLNRLYSYRLNLDTSNIQKVIGEIVEENKNTYILFSTLLTRNQVELLRAIAHEGNVTEVSAKDFIQQYSLGASSSVRNAAKQLIDKEFLMEENGTYSVYDRFLSLWLANR